MTQHSADCDAGPDSPQGMYDMTGWVPLTCAESDDLRGSKSVTPASSLTDPRGNYSSGVTFTEWWADDKPLLRDYLYPDERPCEHFAWTCPTPPVSGTHDPIALTAPSDSQAAMGPREGQPSGSAPAAPPPGGAATPGGA